MAERRWSPSPWTTDNIDVFDADGMRVCRLMHNSEDGPVIAAAPDLYEALDAIEQHLISGCKDVLEGRRIRECARAALAKAEAKDEG